LNARELRRRRAVDELVDRLATDEFQAAHGTPLLGPIVVVIAAYREVDNIGAVVASMPRKIDSAEVSVLVVVDGEDDGTAAVVREAGHYAVVAPVNRGQGAALRLGYAVASSHGAHYIVTADADGQTDPADLEVALLPVLHGEADFVNGSRRLGVTHNTHLVRNIGVHVFGAVISMATRTKVTDSANPIRAMRAEVTKALTLDEPQYQAPELLIGAILQGFRVVERPVTMHRRTSGRSKKGGNLSYGYRYTMVLARTLWRERGGAGAAPTVAQPATAAGPADSEPASS
jgi:glycosyltransferase involved in cell wall biosynthesis